MPRNEYFIKGAVVDCRPYEVLIKDGNGKILFRVETYKDGSRAFLDAVGNPMYVKPYLDIQRLGDYLYQVSFDKLPDAGDFEPPIPGACTSFVQDGKLYRNFDWEYSNLATFRVICPGFEGTAILPGLTDGNLNDKLIRNLPYCVVDGKNSDGIMVSTHVLFNDWDWAGTGNVPLYSIPFIILSQIHSLEDFETQMAPILSEVYATAGLTDKDYLLQFLVTDGTTTYAILPPEAATGSYQVVDISANPKLTNFRWVEDAIVDRTDLQTRPTGVERWNTIPASLKDLRFTLAYESADRLSEFIGIDGTTKDSTDEELISIYDQAHVEYLIRQRDGKTWQTMHSVVYSSKGREEFYVQENFDKNYGDYSVDGKISEIGEVGQTEPSDELAVGGIFLRRR